MNCRIRQFHRSMGVVVALFIFIFAITGIVLNHAGGLKLAQRNIRWHWLMECYGMRQVHPDASYLLDNKAISQIGNRLFVGAKPVTYIEHPLLGGVTLEDIIVLATDHVLILLSRDGEYVERLGAESGIPHQIQNIGLFHGDPVLQTKEGMTRSNYMLDQWEPISLQGVTWSVNSPLPAKVEQDLDHYFYGKGISLERLILDIHSGHILGKYGMWIMDILGLWLIILSFTGIWMWGRRLH